MHHHWTRRQCITRVGAAAAAVHTLDQLDFCCVMAAESKTAKDELFELKPVADGIYAAVKQAAAAGASLEEMQKKLADDLAPKYEQGMSKYPLGRYRDRVGLNIEMVYKKVVQKS
ncbi:MAG: hypothetical protein FJZ47_00475 [Candidatus Tectomicrobia bacterium]|uniref:Uncharacterized protein n=1 Tax=Tectimicrobiota bacterium TaxID=2528274 RepID=A0A938B0V9_UNCTE|nr:hypothetical protein [Candidatus Tectomicrobia bacterium]